MKIGKTKLEVVCGDITGISVEAVVNPANDMLWMGGGVSSQIRKAGGDSIEQEALAKAPAAIGDAVVTDAGDLHARKVIHAVVTGQDLVATEPAIRGAVTSSLKQADSLHCTSIAIPMLTTDISHIEVHIAACIIVEETVNYLINNNKSLEYVVFVEKDETIRDIINNVLMEMFTKHG